FTLSLQNTTTGTGITYQWQSSPDNSTWTNIAGATSSTTEQTQSTATYYRCAVICSAGGPGFSNSIQIVMGGTCQCTSYCVPNYVNYDGTDYVSSFTIDSYTRASGSTPLPG